MVGSAHSAMRLQEDVTDRQDSSLTIEEVSKMQLGSKTTRG